MKEAWTRMLYRKPDVWCLHPPKFWNNWGLNCWCYSSITSYIAKLSIVLDSIIFVNAFIGTRRLSWAGTCKIGRKISSCCCFVSGSGMEGGGLTKNKKTQKKPKTRKCRVFPKVTYLDIQISKIWNYMTLFKRATKPVLGINMHHLVYFIRCEWYLPPDCIMSYFLFGFRSNVWQQRSSVNLRRVGYCSPQKRRVNLYTVKLCNQNKCTGCKLCCSCCCSCSCRCSCCCCCCGGRRCHFQRCRLIALKTL